MKQPSWKRLLEHIDREEIISKLTVGTSPEEVNEWLRGKYSLASEKKYVISAQSLKTFKDNYLDFYSTLKADFSTVKTAMKTGASVNDLELAVKDSPAYKDALQLALNQEIDLKQTIQRFMLAVEFRLGQIYDTIQEQYRYDPQDVNPKLDNVFIRYIEAFTPILEKADKILNNAPDQVVQHNITVQHIDQHIGVFYEAIRQTLAQMDMSSSMLFMELFNEKLNALKDPTLSPPDRLNEIKALNAAINTKLNESPVVINAHA